MNSKYKDCQYYFEGRCRCMDFSFNQDFYECPQCEDVSYCYYKQLKRCEAKLKKIKSLINKLDLSLGCTYGDYDCDNCSDLSEDIVCSIKLQKVILDIIEGAEDE